MTDYSQIFLFSLAGAVVGFVLILVGIGCMVFIEMEEYLSQKIDEEMAEIGLKRVMDEQGCLWIKHMDDIAYCYQPARGFFYYCCKCKPTDREVRQLLSCDLCRKTTCVNCGKVLNVSEENNGTTENL